VTVIAATILGQLVAYPGRLQTAVEPRRAEQNVPDREQHREVAAAQAARTSLTLMPDADGVMLSMERGLTSRRSPNQPNESRMLA